ncbi:formyltetrahydrofolate deformylase [Victivallis sp. Marseille-Q1083]|uniref:formyltetrahydrofolate deformylase n=1 Tax=Victivallis sp. Marseille-Q1083 TaxID=2717288 RepID=UPI00158ABF7B|nr:formyltetrahydrofolate deformylase [Victivallis sp. Marseille-Q1083]
MKQAVFLIQCQDQKGLVTKITGFFYALGLNILHCQQYTDAQEDRYFMRVKIDLRDMAITRKRLEADFAVLAAELALSYEVHYTEPIRRMAILVSKTSHCLYDLLVHTREGDLPCEIPLIVSNHPELEYVADQFRVPFYCLPVEPGRKAEQEKRLIDMLDHHRIDLVVMARYMQILSDDFIAHYPGQIINIHHAFLPAFQGANPYQRAWERGVKMIGATAHYATAELDEGPIIEQDVERISHEDDPADMKRLGKEIERRVLTRAVKAHLEHRIITSGRRTIIFAG